MTNAPRLVLVKPKRVVPTPPPAVLPTMRLRVVASTAAGRIGFECDAPVVGLPHDAIAAYIANAPATLTIESVTVLWVRGA